MRAIRIDARTMSSERESQGHRGSPISASAPGKLLIAGEYAVLEGAPALVIAINRRARADFHASGDPRDQPISPLHLAIGEVLGLTAEEIPQLHLDSSTLFHGSRKLGLGASAAACVAGVSALSPPTTPRDTLLALSKEAHKRFQSGLGSGFDVAASTYGGAIAYTQDARPRRLILPQDLRLQAFAWSQSASTPAMIDKWRLVRTKRPLLDAAAIVCDAAPTSADALIDAVAEFQSRLLTLDKDYALGISAPLQHELTSQAQAIAKKHDARMLFKQSGAGGGDVGIALSNSAQALRAFASIAVQSGLTALDVQLEMEGVNRE